MARARILIAASDPEFAAGLAADLKSLGYAVTGVVSSPEAAWKKAEETRPDLVLVDLKLMGERKKDASTRKLRELLPHGLLYLVGDEDRQSWQQAKITHSFDYLRKSYDSRELETIIDMALYRQKSEGEKACQSILRDISAPQGAAEELEHLASFPRLNPNPVLAVDKSGAVTYYNAAALQVLEKLGIGRDVEAFLPEDLEEIQAAARWKGEKSFYREVRIKEKVFGENISFAGPFDVLRIYASDITARKRAEMEREELLAEVQRINEELQAQTEELQAQTEELQTAHQELVTALAALGESREDLNRAQAVAHTGSWRMDVQRNELTWSDENHRIFGIPQGTPLTYERFLATVHPEDRAYVDEKWTAALRGEPYDIEHRIVVSDTVKWVRERAELEFDPLGLLLGGFGTTQDITAPKHTEEAIIRAKKDWERTFDAVPDLITILDRDHHIVRVNRATAQALGKEPHELRGKPCYEFMHESGCIPSHCPHQQLLLDGREHTAELRELNRDLLVTTSPILDDNGQLIGSVHVARDITDRKQAEEALRESEARFVRLFMSAPLPLCLVNQEGVLTHFNDRFVQVFGYTHEDVPTLKEWWELAYPDEQYRRWVVDTWEAAVNRAAAEKTDIEPIEYRVTCKNGAVRLVEISGITIDDSFLATFIDVTARKRGEEALRRAHDDLEQRVVERTVELRQTVEHLQLEITERQLAEEALEHERQRLFGLLEQMPAFVHLQAPDYSFRFANREFRERFGEPGDKTCYTLLWGRDHPCPECPTFTVFHTGEPKEWEWQAPDGRVYQIYDYPYTDVDGSPLVLEMGIDITERKRAEKQAEIKGRLYRVLSRVNEAIVRASDQETLFQQACRIAVEEGLFRMAWVGLTDPAAQTVRMVAHYGFEKGYLETLAIPLADVPESRGPTGVAVREGRYDICNDFATDPRMSPWREKALERGYHSSGGFPLRVGSEVVGALTLYAERPGFFTTEEIALLESMASDLSFALESMDREAKRRQAEAEVRRLNEELEERVKERTAQLEAANKELEAFSYSVSHDLRTPLRAIEGFARILMDDHGEKLAGEGLRLLNVIRSNTGIMGQLIDDLLALSRLGRQELRFREIDLEGLVTAICGELRAQAPERQIQFNLNPLPPAYGDQTLIKQVLVNLLGNAVKFTQPREKAIIEVGGWTEEKENIYFIKDNGVGFDMRYVDKIFGVFQRLHRREEFEGTGVGLAIVQRIIQRHSGRVWATGQVNRGAVLYFSLPRQEEKEEG